MAVTAPYGTDQAQPVVFVTGYVPGVNGTKDARTVAFKSDLGFKWEQTLSYQPPGVRYNGDDTPVAIAALGTRVAVAITSQSGTGGDDIQLLTYDRITGAPLSGWDQTRFSAGPADYAIGVQFHGLSDLVLTGNLNDTIAAWYLQESNFAYGVTASRQYAPAFSAYGHAMHHIMYPGTGAAITYLTGYRVAGGQKDLLLVRFNWGMPSASATWYDEQGADDEGLAVSRSLPADYGTPMIGVTGYRTVGGIKKELTILFDDVFDPPQVRWISAQSDGTDDRGVAIQVMAGVAINGTNRVYTTGQQFLNGSYDWRTAHYDDADPGPGNPKQPMTQPLMFIGAAGGNDVPAGMIYHGYPSLWLAGRTWGGVSGDDFMTQHVRDLSP